MPAAKAAGCVVVDNSSAFRMDPNTPLVVPEVNGADLARHNGVVANPNCTAAILSVAVWPIHQAAGVKRIVVSTYQSASGAGAAAMQELEDQARDFSAGKEIKRTVFPHQIAFNLFSHNTKVAENGYNEEENKVVEETRKMFHLPELPIAPTCIRVPVLRAHSEAITLELDKPLSPEEARAILAKAPGVKVVDDAAANHFPMPLEASGDLDVHVGRIRRDLSNPNGLMLFVAGDQLLKGAAWNAVQIAEELRQALGQAGADGGGAVRRPLMNSAAQSAGRRSQLRGARMTSNTIRPWPVRPSTGRDRSTRRRPFYLSAANRSCRSTSRRRSVVE